MDNKWSEFRVESIMPDAVATAADVVTTLADGVTSVLSTTRAALKAAAVLAASTSSNPIELALRQTLNEIDTYVTGITENTAAHAIMIPIQKQYFGRGRRPPADRVPPEQAITSAQAFADDNGFPIRGPNPATISFINGSATAVAGNQGFWRALVMSLMDEGDNNVPDFPSGHAVGGVCIIVGARNYGQLQGSFDLLENLFSMGNRATLSANTRPVANNLRARIVPILGGTARVGVQLDWDPVPPLLGIPLFSDEQLILKEIFVVRSTDPRFRERFGWSQHFSRQPRDATSDLQIAGETRVLARLPNDGFTARYIDTDPTLTEGVPYFYGLAMRYSIDEVWQPMGSMSNAVRTRFTRGPQGTRRSVAPDWWATSSVIELIPEVELLLNTIRLSLAGLGTRTITDNGASAVILQTIRQLDVLVERGIAIATEISAITERIRGLSDLILAATTSTVFSVSTGGTNAWMGELASRLSDKDDPSRPPFDNNELVAGLVIVAGAPNLPELKAFLALLELLFGSGDTNDLLTAIDAVEVATRDAEVVSFGPSMRPARSTPEPEEPPRSTPVFGEDMRPAATVDCD